MKFIFIWLLDIFVMHTFSTSNFFFQMWFLHDSFISKFPIIIIIFNVAYPIFKNMLFIYFHSFHLIIYCLHVYFKAHT